MAKVRKDWLEHLSPELRERFESGGEELVIYDVQEHRYKRPEKHYAASAWLAEKQIWNGQLRMAEFGLLIPLGIVGVLVTP
jgi:hypothetical protein